MWPKALTSLIELAPHITRLLPMADQFFRSKTADADASSSAMKQMAEGLRGDLGQVTASHAGLYRQLNDQSEKLSTIGADLRSAKLEIEASQARMAALEKQLKTLQGLLLAVLGASLIILTLVILRK